MIPKKKLIAVAVAALLLAGVCVVGSAQDGHSGVCARSPVPACGRWVESPQETQALGLAASGLDWSGVQGADPQVVALSLEIAGRDQQLSAADEAQLALQLATSSAQLAAAGLDDHAQAAAAPWPSGLFFPISRAGLQTGDRATWVSSSARLLRMPCATRCRPLRLAVSRPGPDSQDGQDHGQGQGGGVGPITPAGGTFPPPHPGR